MYLSSMFAVVFIMFCANVVEPKRKENRYGSRNRDMLNNDYEFSGDSYADFMERYYGGLYPPSAPVFIDQDDDEGSGDEDYDDDVEYSGSHQDITSDDEDYFDGETTVLIPTTKRRTTTSSPATSTTSSIPISTTTTTFFKSTATRIQDKMMTTSTTPRFVDYVDFNDENEIEADPGYSGDGDEILEFSSGDGGTPIDDEDWRQPPTTTQSPDLHFEGDDADDEGTTSYTPINTSTTNNMEKESETGDFGPNKKKIPSLLMDHHLIVVILYSLLVFSLVTSIFVVLFLVGRRSCRKHSGEGWRPPTDNSAAATSDQPIIKTRLLNKPLADGVVRYDGASNLSHYSRRGSFSPPPLPDLSLPADDFSKIHEKSSSIWDCFRASDNKDKKKPEKPKRIDLL